MAKLVGGLVLRDEDQEVGERHRFLWARRRAELLSGHGGRPWMRCTHDAKGERERERGVRRLDKNERIEQ